MKCSEDSLVFRAVLLIVAAIVCVLVAGIRPHATAASELDAPKAPAEPGQRASAVAGPWTGGTASRSGGEEGSNTRKPQTRPISPVINGNAVFRYPEGRYGSGELRYIKGVPVLIVRGSHREIGEQIGRLALKPAAQVADLVGTYANQNIPKALRPLADAAVRSMYAKFPREYREELEAMAAAADVDLSVLVTANTIIDLYEMIGCSSLMVSSARSTTGGPLYSRNVDAPYVKGLAEFSLLIVYHPDGCHAFAMPNLPGFLMFSSGMNCRGLAVGSHSVPAPLDRSERFDLAGESSAVAGRRLIEGCGTVDEVRNWPEQHRLMRCVSIAACDRDGQCVLEVTTKRVLSRSSKDGLCCATNHFRHDDLAGDEKCWRYDVLDGARKKDRLGIEEVAAFMKAANQGKMTIHTMVFEVSPLVIHLAMGPGPATDYRLTSIGLSGLLGPTTTTAPSPRRQSNQGP